MHKPTCNIGAKGKAARLAMGFISVVAGVVVAALLLNGVLAGWGWWVLAGAAMGSGVFAIYEGWAGWCALRAIGIKTPW